MPLLSPSAPIVLLVTLAWVSPELRAAQVPIPTPQPQQPDTVRDTIPVPPFRFEPPIPPLGALWRSMLLPGWGQAILQRRVTGAVFVFWEGVALTMSVKAHHQLRYMRATGSEDASLKKQELQDWIVILVFNHLMAGAEAFVSAMLWDFPGELEGRSLPGGDVGLGMRVPFSLPSRR